jgi:uncharacterized membrane protein YdjX (TVP38/TMEM64 family)
MAHQETATPAREAGARRFAAAGIRRGDVIRVILLAGFLAGAMWLLHATPLGRFVKFHNIARIQEWLKQWGGWAWVVFVAAGTALLALGFPRIVLSAVAGAMFGVLIGTVLALVTTTVAAAPPFFYTQWLGRDMVLRKMGDRLTRLDDLLKEHGFMVLLLIRLCPIGNAFITNCLAGVSAIPFRTYILSSAIGFFPETFIFAVMGAGLAGDFYFRMISGVVLLVVFSLFFIWYFSRYELAVKIIQILREGKK